MASTRPEVCRTNALCKAVTMIAGAFVWLVKPSGELSNDISEPR